MAVLCTSSVGVELINPGVDGLVHSHSHLHPSAFQRLCAQLRLHICRLLGTAALRTDFDC